MTETFKTKIENRNVYVWGLNELLFVDINCDCYPINANVQWTLELEVGEYGIKDTIAICNEVEIKIEHETKGILHYIIQPKKEDWNVKWLVDWSEGCLYPYDMEIDFKKKEIIIS